MVASTKVIWIEMVKKWSDAGNSLMVDLTSFPDALSMRYERGVKGDSKLSGQGKLEV